MPTASSHSRAPIHLDLPDSPAEPRGEMSDYGCVADLRDTLVFVRRAMAQAVPAVASWPFENPDSVPIDAPPGEDLDRHRFL